MISKQSRVLSVCICVLTLFIELSAANHAKADRVVVADTFGANDSYGNLGGSVAGPNTNAAEIEHAYTFTASASGLLSEVEVVFEHSHNFLGPHLVHFSITEKLGDSFPDSNRLLETWTLDSFEQIGPQRPPTSLVSQLRPSITAGKEYWLWADWGTDDTHVGWMFTTGTQTPSTRAFRFEGQDWEVPTDQRIGVFRVTVVPEPRTALMALAQCLLCAGFRGPFESVE